jgi:hypothetical protein
MRAAAVTPLPPAVPIVTRTGRGGDENMGAFLEGESAVLALELIFVDALGLLL